MTALSEQHADERTRTGVGYDPLRDKSYQATALGRDIADFLAWCELGGMSPRTLVGYEPDLARGALMFPTKGIDELTDGDAMQIARMFPAGSRRVRVASWKSFYKWGVRTRRVTVNPFDSLPILRKPHPKVPTVFTDVEAEALLTLDLRDAACMCMLLDAGLRKAEARHIRLRDCLPESGQVIILHGKGSKERVVPMTARLSHVLNELLLIERVEPDDYLWYRTRANHLARHISRDRPIGEGTFARWWRLCIEQAGVKYRVPHTTRHTFATRWSRLGLPLEDIQKLLGHASINTTAEIYVHSTIYDVAARMKAIELRMEVDAT